MNKTHTLDLNPLSKEFLLLLSFAGICSDSVMPEHSANQPEAIDWNHFVQLAKHHRVYPTVYLHAKKMDDERIPAEVMQAFHHEYNRNTLQMLRLTAEMKKNMQLVR